MRAPFLQYTLVLVVVAFDAGHRYALAETDGNRNMQAEIEMELATGTQETTVKPAECPHLGNWIAQEVIKKIKQTASD